MQFSNIDNIECHELITAPEIFNDLKLADKKIHAFIHGSGTGGTIEGVRKYTIKNKLDTKVFMVQPSDSPHNIQGIADGKDFLAKQESMNGVLKVSTEQATARSIKFAKDTGILVGISSGANLVACENYESNNNLDGAIVTILCDRGERYLSIY